MDSCKWIAVLLIFSINAYRYIVMPLIHENNTLRLQQAMNNMDRYDQRLLQFDDEKHALASMYDLHLRRLEGKLADDLDDLGVTARPLAS